MGRGLSPLQRWIVQELDAHGWLTYRVIHERR
jgi:hypothetical protein